MGQSPEKPSYLCACFSFGSLFYRQRWSRSWKLIARLIEFGLTGPGVATLTSLHRSRVSRACKCTCMRMSKKLVALISAIYCHGSRKCTQQPPPPPRCSRVYWKIVLPTLAVDTCACLSSRLACATLKNPQRCTEGSSKRCLVNIVFITLRNWVWVTMVNMHLFYREKKQTHSEVLFSYALFLTGSFTRLLLKLKGPWRKHARLVHYNDCFIVITPPT